MLDEEISVVRRLKEAHVRQVVAAGGDQTDIPPIVFAIRGDQWACVLAASEVDRDAGLRVVHMAVPAFSADSCVFVADSFMSADRNPDTGERWEPGAMQRAAETASGRERGVVQDTLIFMHCDGRKCNAVNVPYRLAGDEVRWQPKQELTHEDGQSFAQGLIPQVLVAAFGRTRLSDYFDQIGKTPEAFGLTAEQHRLALDGLARAGMAKLGMLILDVEPNMGTMPAWN